VAVRFCYRTIDRRGRTHDQMVQAANFGELSALGMEKILEGTP